MARTVLKAAPWWLLRGWAFVWAGVAVAALAWLPRPVGLLVAAIPAAVAAATAIDWVARRRVCGDWKRPA